MTQSFRRIVWRWRIVSASVEASWLGRSVGIQGLSAFSVHWGNILLLLMVLISVITIPLVTNIVGNSLSELLLTEGARLSAVLTLSCKFTGQ